MKKTETVFSDIDSVDDPDRKVAFDCIAAGIRASDHRPSSTNASRWMARR